MKVVLISMPDVIPIVIHEMAIHTPNHGIACIGGHNRKSGLDMGENNNYKYQTNV